MSPSKKAAAHSSRQTQWLAALGMLFVLGSVTMLLRESFFGGQPSAEISIRIDEILPSPHGYLVSLKIENSGKATAASLGIEGVLTQGKINVETSVITIDYVAAGSERDAALFFSNDPREGELAVRPKGYIEP